MADPIVNFFSSTLVGNYTANATTFTIETGTGDLLPDPATDGAYNLVVYNESEIGVVTTFDGGSTDTRDDLADTTPEIVRVTAKSGDTLTVTRAQEGTTATEKVDGNVYRIMMAATKKVFDDILNPTTLSNVESITFDSTGDEVFQTPVGTTAQRPNSPSAGYMRWNTTEGKLEFFDGSFWNLVTGFSTDYGFGTAWATTTALNEAKREMGSAGDTSSALCFAGYTGSQVATTEKWNGSSWATTSSMNQAKWVTGSFGTSNDALSVGGYTGGAISSVEIWATSSWATTTAYPQNNYYNRGVGSVSDAVVFGGVSVNTRVDSGYKWNGSSWATTTSMNQVRLSQCLFGDTSSAIASEGESTGAVKINSSEKWNGSSWATTSASTTSSFNMGHNKTGSFGLSFAGDATSGYTNISRVWSGSVWATTSSYSISVSGALGVGSPTSALGFGGDTGGATNPTANSYLWS